MNRLTRCLVLGALALSSVALAQPANDLCANAQVIPAGTYPVLSSTVNLTGAAAVSEAAFSCQTSHNSSVWYSFTPATTGLYTIHNCTPAGNTLSDTVISLYTGGCAAPAESACNDDSCSFKSSLTTALNSGTTYLIQVAKFGSTLAGATDTMQIAVDLTLPPVNDTCSGALPLTLNTPKAFSLNSLTVNDSTLGGGAACFTGLGHSTTTLTSPGRDVVFGFTPANNGTYSVRMTPSSSAANAMLYLTNTCTAAMTPPYTYSPPECVVAANRTGLSSVSAEELVCVALTGGTPYFVWADEGTAVTGTSTYELEVSACFPEAEPNDTPATANPLACPATGRMGVAADADFYALGTATAGTRVFALIDGNASGTTGSSTTDFDLRVTTTTDTLEYDDLDAENPFGSLSGTVAGTTLSTTSSNFLRVSHFSSTTATEPYRLYATVQTSAATAEVEPNDVIATASQGANNYFSGVVTATTDLDLFAFDARIGDLVFLSVDGHPARAGTASGNHNLALLDDTGTVLLTVNSSTTASSNTASATLTGTTPTAAAESIVYRARKTGRLFARVGRSSATGTGEYLLSISFNCATSIGAPVLGAIVPNTGTISGGTSVTINGTNLSAGAVVLLGGTQVQVVSSTATSLTFVTPPGVAGALDVTVINPGNQAATSVGGFTYISPVIPPTVTSIVPAFGPTAGGNQVVINGTIFKTGAEVRFTVGATTVQATNVVVTSAARLTATVPANAAGFASVTVRNPVDMLEVTVPNAYEYLAPPTLGTVTPNTGLTTGLTSVTIAGTGLRAGATVRFGGTLGTSATVDMTGTSITVNTPAAAVAGPVDLLVTNPDGQSATLTGGFTYRYPAPTITTVAPVSGFAAGGTALTINGTGFLAAPVVTIGGAMATMVVRVSATRITCVTPMGFPGPADIVITNSDLQAVTFVGGFTYVAGPTVSMVSPNHGPVQGGTVITLTGTGFLQGASVTLGGVPAFAVTIVNSTTATAVTNGAPASTVDVKLANPDTQSSTLMQAFTFDPAPTLTSAIPITGSIAGGTTVTLTGTGFLTGATVLFGTDPATNMTVTSPTSLTAESPMHAVGVVSLTVRNSDGQFAELPRAFRFVQPPTLTALAPNMGDVAGGTVTHLTGSGFNAGSTVTFDSIPATQVTFVSDTELIATTPGHARGMVDVVVWADGAPVTLTYGFTYTRDAPTVTLVAPLRGPTTGGALLTLTGTNFAAGATVKVGGVAATDVVVVSPVLVRAVAPAHSAGSVDVELTNEDMKVGTLANAFTYVVDPNGNMGTVTDGGMGGLGMEPVGGGGGTGGVSCGCSSFDGSLLSLGGMLALLFSSRRRRSAR